MKKILEKVLDVYIKYKLKDDKENTNSKSAENDILDHDKRNLDDYDDWTEDEAEDLLTGGKSDLLYN